MKKVILLSFLLATFALKANAQITFIQIDSSAFVGEGMAVRQTSGGEYLVTGSSNIQAGSIYIVGADSIGFQQWQKQFGQTGFDAGKDIQKTMDGSYIVLGQSQNPSIGYMGNYLIKFNSGGDTLWTRYIYNAGYSLYGNSIQILNTGEIIIAGNWNDPFGGGSVPFLLKTDSSGNQQWLNFYNHYYGNFEIIQSEDGGFTTIGRVEDSQSLGTYNLILTHYNSNGDTLWNRRHRWANCSY